jgi:predicted molibdopterin-dependent oxidoreductase YjgC
VLNIVIDDVIYNAHRGELLVDLIRRTGGSIPHVCYHPQLGPIKTCDTCMVEANGQLVRACATTANEGVKISTRSSRASAAQVEAFDRILGSHLLYCTVCDNNNGNCTIHNTTKLLAIEHQRIPFQSKPYEVDNTNPFYRYDPDQCMVQLISRYGKVRVRALVTDRVQGRELYMPMNSVESPVNLLTSSHTDPMTNTPAYKEASVHMNVLSEVGESPLPRINSRFGHPTPQHGVEVERKWKRADYTPPGSGLVQLQTK